MLAGKSVIITGSTRGIGRAIALRMAAAGAQVVITGKTIKPHEHLPGTIHSVAEEITEAGGTALPIECDVRDERAIQALVEETVSEFGGVDILINNASAIALRDTERMTPKRFDLLMGVNMRGTFFVSRACLSHLERASNPHIVNMAPPLHMDAKWFTGKLAYSYSKYGMSVCTLGMAAEFQDRGIAVNSLWPKTTIATSAIKVHFPPEIYARSRHPAIVADAAYAVVTQDSRELTGQFLIDEEVLRDQGVTDFSSYAVDANQAPYPDFFLEEDGL